MTEVEVLNKMPFLGYTGEELLKRHPRLRGLPFKKCLSELRRVAKLELRCDMHVMCCKNILGMNVDYPEDEAP